MALDGLFLHRLLTELSGDLCGAKVNRIHQPDKHTLTMKLNSPARGNFTLLLSAHPQNARCHLTTAEHTNPTSPSLFAMVLRKHIEGGRILSVSQNGLDRIACFEIEGKNEIGDRERRELVLEIMGKHSNLILLDQDRIILAAIKPYGSSVSRHRQVLPRVPYLLPPQQQKLNPLLIDEEEFRTALLAQELTLSTAKAIFSILEGISPQTATELVLRAGLPADYPLEMLGDYELTRLFAALTELLAAPSQPSAGGRDFYFVPPTIPTADARSYDTLSALLDDHFDRKEVSGAFQSRRASLVKIIATQRDKLAKKVSKQAEELATAEGGEQYRLFGELLSANLYRVPNGVDSVTLEDWTHDNAATAIPLLPALTPAANAGRYFKRYAKAKNARIIIEQKLADNRAELDYLESLLYAAENCDSTEALAEIRRETAAAGYIREKRSAKKEKDGAPLPPMETTYQGFTILIGRNNKQNDKLTLRMAAPRDLWLHTKDIPGSHVIIRRAEADTIPDEVIAHAAALAAYHSRARGADKVPVDYTEVRQVKKPNGARPGMVIYFEQTTLFVKPQPLEAAEK